MLSLAIFSLVFLAGGMAILSPLLGLRCRFNLSWVVHGLTTIVLLALAWLVTEPSVLLNDTRLSGIAYASNVISMGVMVVSIGLQGRPKATALALALLASLFLVTTGLEREGATGFLLAMTQWLFVLVVAGMLLAGFSGRRPFLQVLGFPVAMFSVAFLTAPFPMEYWTTGFLLPLGYATLAGLSLGRRISETPSSQQLPHRLWRSGLMVFALYMVGGYYLITDSFEEVSGIKAGSAHNVCLTYEPQAYHECKTLSFSRQVTKKRTTLQDPHPIRDFTTPEFPEITIKDLRKNRTVLVISESVSVSQQGQTYRTFYFTEALHLQIQKEFKAATTEDRKDL